MKRRIRFVALPALALVLVFSACLLYEDAQELVTSRDTLSDPIADIVALRGYLFATNEDRSGHAGSQVDLFKFAPADGFPEGRFDMGLNGVGYLAACSDGESIYLQVRGKGQLFKTSPVGELAWTRWDLFPGGYHAACGIAYRDDVDSFVVVYRRPGTATYVTLQYPRDFSSAPDSPRTHELTLFDSPAGILAVTWHNDLIWALGRDAEGHAVVQGFDLDDNTTTRVIQLEDAAACGITALEGALVVAYPDRHFESVME